jgi:hypothetical protein
MRKKILAIILAAALVFSFSVTAFAETAAFHPLAALKQLILKR